MRRGKEWSVPRPVHRTLSDADRRFPIRSFKARVVHGLFFGARQGAVAIIIRRKLVCVWLAAGAKEIKLIGICFPSPKFMDNPLPDLERFSPHVNRPVEAKVFDFQRQERLKHLIFAAQLTPELLEKLRRTADLIRQMARQRDSNLRLKQLLAHKRAMLYFTQPSTRTFLVIHGRLPDSWALPVTKFATQKHPLR